MSGPVLLRFGCLATAVANSAALRLDALGGAEMCQPLDKAAARKQLAVRKQNRGGYSASAAVAKPPLFLERPL